MLIDTRIKEAETLKDGFNPNVQNNQIPATATGIQKFLFFFVMLFTLTIYYFYAYNYFQRLQVKANEAASNIDVQLKKRRDTLIKLFDATKSAVKYEGGLLADLTKLRTGNNFSPNDYKNGGAKNVEMLNKAWSKMLATFENYPKLSAVDAIRDLMSSADYIEREIAASRRVYNAVATQFNQELYAFPKCCVAAKMKLYNLSLFAATAEERKDVKLNIV